MKAIRIFLLALCAAGVLCAQEVSGEWTAEVQGRRGGTMELRLKLKAEDGLLTGSVRSARGEAAISAGTIDGDNVTFSVITDIDGYQITQRYRGSVEGDVIHFSLTVEDGRSKASPVRDFEAKRIN